MIKKIFLLVVLVGIILPVLPQSLDEVIDKVDLKLRRDKRYLNLNYVEYPAGGQIAEEFLSIPRTDEKEPFQLQAKDNIVYNIVFVREGIQVDSPMVLYVSQITDLAAGGEGFFGATSGPSKDTQIVINFADMYSLRQNQPQVYYKFYKIIDKYLKDNPDSDPPSLLKITPDNEIKTSLGISSRDNTDYLNYMRANSYHWYPRPKIEKKGGGRKKVEPVVASTFKIDATASMMSFSHEVMNFSLGGAAVELGFEDKVLNVLPYQGQMMTVGFRTLVTLSEKKEDIDQAVVIDARLLGRIGFDVWSIAKNIPFLAIAAPKLNTGIGAGVDINVTRPFGMPFMNFYLMAGSPDYSSPAIKTAIAGGKNEAYFTWNAAEASMSFYWNTSDNFVARFRMDVGAGYYDVYRAEYIGKNSKPSTKKEVQANFYPMVQFHFNFAPDDKELFGTKIKIFDGQAKMTSWLKLLELEGGHLFRFEAQYLATPFIRSKRAWDNEGGATVQLRYRYGF